MIEKDLDKVLNYMKQYVENKYEHDSEPMLTWKDLKLVLNEIERLNNIINETKEYLEYQILQLDFYKDTKAKMLGSMAIVLLKGADKE